MIGCLGDAHMPENEHERYGAYIRAKGRQDCLGPLLECLRVEPDEALATSMLAALMEVLGPVDRQGLLDIAPHDSVDFLRTRAEDLLLLEQLSAAGDVDDEVVGRLLASSDWLQRRAVEGVSAKSVLTVLAESGRTRRVRAQAAKRLRSADG